MNLAAALSPQALETMSPMWRTAIDWQATWASQARDNQRPPLGDWSEWGIMAGRGFGKTRTGAEWLGIETALDPDALPAAVIAPTYGDVKFTCFEGPAGLMNVIPRELIEDYNRSDMLITLVNGAVIRGFTAEKPERLRGPQHARIWADELAAWQYADQTWDMAMMGLRLGPSPRVLWTTTPKPRDIIRRLTSAQDNRVIYRGSTYDNRDNLPEAFFRQLEQYEGTTLGRQELMGELIDPEEAGIIRRSWMRLWPAKRALPEFEWIVMSLDTAFTEATMDKKSGDPDYTASTVWGGFRFEDRMNVMLLDCWQEHLGLPDLIKRVRREMNTAYGDDQDRAVIKPLYGGVKPVTSGHKPDILVIEEKGSGISLRQMLEREGIVAHPYNPGRADKLTRLHIVSPIFARRQVWLPESEKTLGKPKNWVDAMIYQLCAFAGPGSTRHDDYVDSTTQALRLLIDKGLLSPAKISKLERDALPPPAPAVNPYAA